MNSISWLNEAFMSEILIFGGNSVEVKHPLSLMDGMDEKGRHHNRSEPESKHDHNLLCNLLPEAALQG